MEYVEYQAKITGAEVIDGALWMAAGISNSQEGKVYAALIPTEDAAVTQTPKAMATEGAYLYTVVEAAPNDKIMVTEFDGTLVRSFDAPGNNATGLAMKQVADGEATPSLWVAVVDDVEGGDDYEARMEPTIGVLYEVNATTGAIIQTAGNQGLDGSYCTNSGASCPSYFDHGQISGLTLSLIHI